PHRTTRRLGVPPLREHAPRSVGVRRIEVLLGWGSPVRPDAEPEAPAPLGAHAAEAPARRVRDANRPAAASGVAGGGGRLACCGGGDRGVSPTLASSGSEKNGRAGRVMARSETDPRSGPAAAWPEPLALGRRGWWALLGWFVIGLLTTLPGLSTKSLTYDEALEARLAQLPIVSQYASYADATARQMDWSSGLVLDSPHL